MLRHLRLIVSLLTLTIFAACSGGGGGGGTKTPPPPNYLLVVGTTPADNAIDVEYNTPIKVSFDETLTEASFVNTNAIVGKLLVAKGLSVLQSQADNSWLQLMDIEVEALKLSDLSTGNYIVTNDPSDESVRDPITDFSINPNSDESALTLKAQSGAVIIFSYAELSETGLFDQNMITLKTSTGESIKGKIQLSTSKRDAFFIPDGYLDYETTYQLTISQALTSASNNKMQAGRTITFTIKQIPPTEYTYYNPVGIDANPLTSIIIGVNFDLEISENDLERAVKVYEVVRNEADEEVEQEVVVSKTLSENRREIIIDRENFYKFSSKYIVRTVGGELSGTAGNSGQLSLAGKDLEFEFQTSVPKIISITPDSETEHMVETEITLHLNFPAAHSVIKNYVDIFDQEGNQYDYVVADHGTEAGKYILTTTNKFLHNRTNTVSVAAGLYSTLGAEVALPEARVHNFQTEPKMIVRLDPYDGQAGVSEAKKIELKFNFPVTVNAANYIFIEEDWEGSRIDVPFTVSKSDDKKTIYLHPKAGQADYEFLFNSNVFVNVDTGIAGTDIAGMEAFNYSFQVKNLQLKIVDATPEKGEISVPVRTDLFKMEFNHQVFVRDDIDAPFWIEYDCPGFANGIIDRGHFSYSGNSIYFDPDSDQYEDRGYLVSGCDHKLVAHPRLAGTRGELFQSEADANNLGENATFTDDSDRYTEFETDWLEVTDIETELAYSDRVAIDSYFYITYSHDLRSDFDSDNFALKEDGYYTKSFSTSKYLDEITVRPYFDLDYGTNYTLWAYKDDGDIGYRVRALSGERMITSYYHEFRTENMPIDIEYAYPQGSFVDVNTDIYFDTNFGSSDQGYPTEVNVDIYAYYGDGEEGWVSSSDYDVDIWGSEVDIDMYYSLEFGTTYEIYVTFVFDDEEEVEYSWSFNTTGGSSSSSTASAKSSSKKKASLTLASERSNKKATINSTPTINRIFKRPLLAKLKDKKRLKGPKRIPTAIKAPARFVKGERYGGPALNNKNRKDSISKAKANRLQRPNRNSK